MKKLRSIPRIEVDAEGLIKKSHRIYVTTVKIHLYVFFLVIIVVELDWLHQYNEIYGRYTF